eukprot:6146814-Lingulodinium_polyedra.AAC.1
MSLNPGRRGHGLVAEFASLWCAVEILPPLALPFGKAVPDGLGEQLRWHHVPVLRNPRHGLRTIRCLVSHFADLVK